MDLKLKVLIFLAYYGEKGGRGSTISWNQFPVVEKQGLQLMKMSLEDKYSDYRGGIGREGLVCDWFDSFLASQPQQRFRL